MKRFILAIICAGFVVAGSFPAAQYLAQEQTGKLARLIQDGRRVAALDMIRSGADVNEAQTDGTRPIHWAVYRVDHDMVAALIAKKAKVDVSNEFGYTPLAEAVKQGDARMVKMLLDAGSGAEGANADGQTALMIAIKNGDLPIFQMLIDAGAKVNVVEKVQDQTPLMWAAANRNGAEMVKVLVAKGASVNTRAKTVDWPSQITSEPRAQYHAYGGLTPLLYASRGGCLGCVEALVAARADVNLPNPEGITPLMIALDNSNNDVAKYLLEHGGNPHLFDIYGRTALYIVIDHAPGAAGAGGAGGGGGAAPGGAGRGGGGGAGAPRGGPGGPGGAGAPGAAVPAVPGAAPAAAGAQPPAVGGRGAGPGGPGGQAAGGRGGGGAQAGRGGGGAGAQAGRGGGGRGGGGGAASTVSSMEIINMLLAAGVDVNPQLNQRRLQGQGGRFGDPLLSSGTTPLMRALVANNLEIARLLLEKGANPNIYGMGISPFLYVSGITSQNTGGRGGVGAVNTELVELMMKHGADVNAQIDGAADYSGRIARALTNDLNATSNEGMTALHAAAQSGNPTFARYLLEHGARADIKDASGRTPLDVLNGVKALQPAIFAEASGLLAPGSVTATVAPPPSNAPRGGGGRGGPSPAAVQEIRTLLEAALKK